MGRVMDENERLDAAILEADQAHDDGASMLRCLEARHARSEDLGRAMDKLDRLRQEFADADALEQAVARVREVIERVRRPVNPESKNITSKAPEAPVNAPESRPRPRDTQVAEAALPATELTETPYPLEYALAYAQLGWPVLPVGADKSPLGGKGIKHTTTDEKTIRQWWERWPDAGIGIHLEAAGLCAIDIDPRAGTTKTPKDFPPTLAARTGGGGWHLVYKEPEGTTLPGKLEPGVDIKHRGYIIVEPSVHPNGRGYAWVDFDPIAAALVGAPEITEFPVQLLLVTRLAAEHRGDELEAALVGDETIEELRSAFAVIPSDDRDLWVRLGHGVKHLGERGLELWLDWSRKSTKFDADDAARVWESLAGERTGYAAVFAEAQRRGWKNPKSAAAQDYSEKVDRTDVGNANLLAQLSEGNLRFVPERRMWIKWTGQRWIEDTHGAFAQREALRVAKHYYTKCSELRKRAEDKDLSDAERKKLLAAIASMAKWEAQCRSKRTIEAMLAVASKFSHMQVPLEQLNRDQWLLGAPNGVVDLRTGLLRAAARDDFVTKQVAAPFNPEAKAPRWRQFIDEITGALGIGEHYTKRSELAKYVQKALGYGLTGSTAEHKMFLAIGDGSNGKNVALDTYQHVAGDYVVTVPPEALMATRFESDAERPTPTAATLAGARAAISSESRDGQRMDVTLIKRHTGGGYLTARQMRENPFRFEMTHKLWLMTNHRPQLDHLDDAIRSRLHLIPFDRQWNRPGHPDRNPTLPDGDKNLAEKLRGEAEGILAWLVAGAVAYAKEGLEPPAEVVHQTREYFHEQDPLGQWLETCERCDPRDGASASTLFDAFERWCEDNDFERWSPNTQKSFSLALKARGIARKKASASIVYGLRLRGQVDVESLV